MRPEPKWLCQGKIGGRTLHAAQLPFTTATKCFAAPHRTTSTTTPPHLPHSPNHTTFTPISHYIRHHTHSTPTTRRHTPFVNSPPHQAHHTHHTTPDHIIPHPHHHTHHTTLANSPLHHQLTSTSTTTIQGRFFSTSLCPPISMYKVYVVPEKIGSRGRECSGGGRMAGRFDICE